MNNSSLSPSDQRFPYQYLGFQWKFLKRDLEFEGVSFDHNSSVKREVEKLENVSINERIINTYWDMLQKSPAPLKEKASVVPFGQTNFVENTELSVPEEDNESDSSDEEVVDETDLTACLNNIRIFRDRENNKVQSPTSAIFEVTLPDLKAQVTTVRDDVRLTESILLRPPVTPVLSFSPKSRRKLLSKKPAIPAQNKAPGQKQTKAVLENNVDLSPGAGPISKKRISMLLTSDRQGQVSLSLAQRTEARLVTVREQMPKVEISKSFKRFIQEREFRLPHFLVHVDGGSCHSSHHNNNSHNNVRRASSQHQSQQPLPEASIATSNDSTSVGIDYFQQTKQMIQQQQQKQQQQSFTPVVPSSAPPTTNAPTTSGFRRKLKTKP